MLNIFKKEYLDEEIQENISKLFVQGKYIKYDIDIPDELICYVNIFILSKCIFLNQYAENFTTKHLLDERGLIIRTSDTYGELVYEDNDSVLILIILFNYVNFLGIKTNNQIVNNKFTELKKILVTIQ